MNFCSSYVHYTKISYSDFGQKSETGYASCFWKWIEEDRAGGLAASFEWERFLLFGWKTFLPKRKMINKMPDNVKTSRRGFLKIGLLATAGLAVPSFSLASISPAAGPREKSLTLLNQHTGESLENIVYWENGNYLTESLDAIDYLCRDYRTGEIMAIDRQLLDLLFEINRRLPASKTENIIISGYRSPETNAQLRSKSRRVAKKSYHLKGQALDIRIPGCDLRNVKKLALKLHKGGVGYYPRSQFVHIDTGPVRAW